MRPVFVGKCSNVESLPSKHETFTQCWLMLERRRRRRAIIATIHYISGNHSVATHQNKLCTRPHFVLCLFPLLNIFF